MVNRWMTDGGTFTSFSKVFQACKDNGKTIKKNLRNGTQFTVEKIYGSNWNRTETNSIAGQCFNY